MSREREILRRAVEIFERKGFAETSMEEIADAVGIKREAIYYYFKNKAQILNAVIRPQSVSLLDGINSILALEIPASEKLLLALQNHLDRFNPSFLEMSVFARDHHFFDGHPEFGELRKIWRSYGEGWMKLISEGQQTGQFVEGLDPKVVAFGILGMCNWLSRWYDPTKSITVREVVRIYSRVISGGLVKNFEETGRFLHLVSSTEAPQPAPPPRSKTQLRSVARDADQAAEAPKRRSRRRVAEVAEVADQPQPVRRRGRPRTKTPD